MIEQMKIAYRYLIIMGLGAFLLLLTLYVPIISSQEDFSIYNTDWNGCSGLGRDVYSTGSFLPTIDVSESSEDLIVHNTLDEYRNEIDYQRSSILVIGPSDDFSEPEGSFVHDFMSAGGIFMLADDFGTGNQILKMLNTSSRISGEVLMDLSFMKKGEFSVTTDLSSHSITRNVSMVLMNYPSSIGASARAVSIMNSSDTSWLDTNRNHVRDADEEKGPFPILTIEPYGKGWLVILSEPSILINQMRGSAGMDNDVLVENLLSFVSKGRETLIIDESHRDMNNPVRMVGEFLSSFDPTHKIAILIVLTFAFLIMETPVIGMVRKKSADIIDRLMKEEDHSVQSNREVLQRLKEEHPEWNQKVLEKLFEEVEGDQ